MQVELVYSDGTSNPSWNENDFRLQDLKVVLDNCAIASKIDNVILLEECNADFAMEITGFDVNRELDVSVRFSGFGP